MRAQALRTSAGRHEGVRDTIVAWAQAIPVIRRGWLVESGGRGDDAVNIAIEVDPVADSEETLVVWLANAERWRAQLQSQLRSTISLEWLDPDAGSSEIPSEAEVLIYERAEPSSLD